ncbi:DUF2142 domain-containing protein [Raoultella planticola]
MGLRQKLCLSGIFLLLMVCLSWVLIVKPPFGSPDELNHTARAYGILNGYMLLKPVGDDGTSGTYVDHTLFDAAKIYRDGIADSGDARSFKSGIEKMKELKWSGHDSAIQIPNVTFYAPLVYFPQSLAYGIGKAFDINFYDTYIISNYLTFAVCIALLFIAYFIYPIPPLAMFFITMPMMAYQLMSPTIDGISVALTVLALSILFKLEKNPQTEKYLSLLILMSVCIFASAGSRANLLLMSFIPLWLYYSNRKKSNLVLFVLLIISTFGWTVFNIVSVHDSAMGRHPGYSNFDLIIYYISHPVELVSVIFNTLINSGLVTGYYHSFIGVLGTLDAPIKDNQRNVFTISMLFIFLSSLIIRGNNRIGKFEVFIILLALSGALLIFPALLVQWTSFPATYIDGVQGRYFIIPAIIFGYAFSVNAKHQSKYVFLILLLAVFSTYTVHSSMTQRYLSSKVELPHASEISSVAEVKNIKADEVVQYHLDVPKGAMKSVAFYMANYNNTSKGIASLNACSDGQCVETSLNINNMVDNSFVEFKFNKPLNIVSHDLQLQFKFMPENGSQPLVIWEFKRNLDDVKVPKMVIDYY